MMLLNLLISIFLLTASIHCLPPTKFQAFHRSGQTFLTWLEDESLTEESYRVYRSEKPINNNLSSAKLLAEVGEGSSYFTEMHTCDGKLLGEEKFYLDRFIIQPAESGLGQQLKANQGIFVWTVKEAFQADYYYAITTVSKNGSEDKLVTSENSVGPIKEKKSHIGAIKYFSGELQDYYIMWLDYEIFNNYYGYAFPFAITRNSFKEGGNPPTLHLNGHGARFPGTKWTNYGNLDYGLDNGIPTWYFGHHMSKSYRGKCSDVNLLQLKDSIANYIQYKHMQAVLWARRHYKMTAPKLHVTGHSMGAGGAMSLLTAYPSFVSSIWANQGNTQFRTSWINKKGDTTHSIEIRKNYGAKNLKNPVKFLPFNEPEYPALDWVTRFNGSNIYDMRDIALFLKNNTATSFGLFGLGHTFNDYDIPYKLNAIHFEDYIKNSRHCFTYGIDSGGHGWGKALGRGLMDKFMRWDESRPGFSNVPPMQGCKNNNPSQERPGSRTYMSYVEWGTMDHPVMGGKKISETDNSWSIPIINASKCANKEKEYKVDITPRNLQKLKLCMGDKFAYRIKNSKGAVEHHGTLTADDFNLLLIPNVPIRLSGSIAEVALLVRGKNHPCEQQGPTSLKSGQPSKYNKGTRIRPDVFVSTIRNSFEFRFEFRIRPSVQSKKITFQLYTIGSKLVEERITLFSTNGYSSFTWPKNDIAGRKFSAGIYFYKIIVNNNPFSGKILLV